MSLGLRMWRRRDVTGGEGVRCDEEQPEGRCMGSLGASASVEPPLVPSPERNERVTFTCEDLNPEHGEGPNLKMCNQVSRFITSRHRLFFTNTNLPNT